MKLRLALMIALASQCHGRIDRKGIVQSFNPHRTGTKSTPMLVGNGDFAYGADITGLQTFQAFNTLSSWCWHNSSLPTTPGQNSPENYTGVDWWTHDRLVNYAQPNSSQPEISQWLIGNPHRVNLARIGFDFRNSSVGEADLQETNQTLDMYSGMLISSFILGGKRVEVKTVVDPWSSTVAFSVSSDLLIDSSLSVFFDFPYAVDNVKFEAPSVGVFNATDKHSTTVFKDETEPGATVIHNLDATSYTTHIGWNSNAVFSGPLAGTHKYLLKSRNVSTLEIVSSFSPASVANTSGGFEAIKVRSIAWWDRYWTTGAFIDMTRTATPQAFELQRRVVQSQYLLAVNYAGRDPPQESGLTNNGWYGKFHMEMYLWHNAHWALWNHWDLYQRSINVYERFLPSSLERAQLQGYAGARWGKMSDPSGRSAPGEINSLLVWQQPHPMYFAELEYQSRSSDETLQKWDRVVGATADFMASYAWWNESTTRFDLGPPMHVVSENTAPNATINPTFELAYWRFGLEVAARWRERQGLPVPGEWTRASRGLAPLPIEDQVYVTYEGIDNMWQDPELSSDHPGLLGIYGLLPPTSGVDTTVMQRTMDKVLSTWNLTAGYGWDFPFMAMTAARLGDAQRAVDLLTHKSFEFDDIGMPLGGTRVTTPYFPASASLLFAVAGMAAGWRCPGQSEEKWPAQWVVESESFLQPL